MELLLCAFGLRRENPKSPQVLLLSSDYIYKPKLLDLLERIFPLTVA